MACVQHELDVAIHPDLRRRLVASMVGVTQITKVKARKMTRADFISAKESLACRPPSRLLVQHRAKMLIAEELTLRELRQALDLTQAQVGATLGIGQEHVSRIEGRSDMLLSTLVNTIKAMGGDLKLIVQLPDRPAISLALFDVNQPELLA
jgi:DNA-binding XRE family transcriptional regulator